MGLELLLSGEECVTKFCYLGDMIGAGGGAADASRTRVRCSDIFVNSKCKCN